MKAIILTKGKIACVDDSDFDRVNCFKWYAHLSSGNWYARRNVIVNGMATTQRLHQFLLPGHPRVDHKSGDTLDNCRGNLRPATHGQNMANQRRKKISSGGYKGVRKSLNGRFQARIRQTILGTFATAAEAARAYDVAAKQTFGAFACPNFP